MRKVQHLSHGGIMANYRCTAACRHCLYACSPERADGYISKAIATSICKLLRAGGCRSVHIGGGEPFLNFDGLLDLVRIVADSGINVEYIETNAYWVADEKQAALRLKELLRAGADTLCISVDPFHAEYVPVGFPLSLAGVCNDVGFRYFLWQERYLQAFSQLEPDRIYTREEMETLISPRYVLETAQSYGLHLGGRATGIEAEYSTTKPIDSIISEKQCRSLLSGDHFHVDLHGRYIPPGCTGIAIPLDEAVNGIPDGKYPVFDALVSGGTTGLLRHAKTSGFVSERDSYPSACALCFHIRCWLSVNAPSMELDAEHYVESLRHW